MNNIVDLLKKNTKEKNSKPILLDLSVDDDVKKLEVLFKTEDVQVVSDDFEEQHKELFAIKNPSLVYSGEFEAKFENYYKNLLKKHDSHVLGKWVFYPWLFKLVHILDEEDFFLVRTARNQNLITKDEQKKYYNATIGIGGLSVGSSIAFAIVLQGGAKRIKLADMDRLALTNTNRILSGVDRLGMFKVEMAARTIYEINPYAEVEIFSEGLNEDTFSKFFNGLDLVIDELDNIAVKYRIREYAKKNKIPVLMAADNGDNAVIDIERYDLDPKLEFFQGRAGNITYDSLKNMNKFEIGKLITKLVGPENVTERMQASLMEMGKTIVSWPQLGGAALINGAAVAYCARKVINKEKLENNRALVSLDEKLIPDFMSHKEKLKRKRLTESFKKQMGL